MWRWKTLVVVLLLRHLVAVVVVVDGLGLHEPRQVALVSPSSAIVDLLKSFVKKKKKKNAKSFAVL